MGSLESARQVGEMARAHLRAAPEPGPWWQDLLDYEYAYFLQAATAERATSIDRPSPGVSALCRHFAWALPEILPRLRAGSPIASDLQREVTLMFSRTHAGNIYVIEVEPAMEGVFRAVNGQRTVHEIATAAGILAGQVHSVLTSLAGVGAVQLPAVWR